MTQTKATRSSSKKSGGGSYESKHGPIPADNFENEPSVRPMPLDAEGRKKFDAETERLKQFRKK